MAIEQAQEGAARAKQLRRAGDQDSALRVLRSTLGPLEADLASGDQAAAQLADTLGQIGGTLREQGQLIEAALAYDAGFEYEARYELPSTYNALNRVVTRVMICPEALSDPEALRSHDELPWIDVGAEAARVHDTLAARDDADEWEVGDLALSAALTGRELESALNRLANEVQPWVRESYRPIVDELAGLDTPRRADLERLASVLGD